MLIRSFARTVDCGFRYVVVLGYDVGDKFWDLGGGVERGKKWFEAHVKKKLARANVRAELRFAKVNNTVKKPGPVFTGITKEAHFNAGADYIYRVNDDTELATRWAKHFVAAFSCGAGEFVLGGRRGRSSVSEASSPSSAANVPGEATSLRLATMGNVGAVGPACRQGNRRILTHDFTHKTHMEIFGGQYYPPALRGAAS